MTSVQEMELVYSYNPEPAMGSNTHWFLSRPTGAGLTWTDLWKRSIKLKLKVAVIAAVAVEYHANMECDVFPSVL